MAIVEVAGIPIGSLDKLVIMAGPCAVESRDQVFRIAESVKGAGADFLRGGAFKPRTRGREWEGLQERGLDYLAQASEQFEIPVVTEILSENDIGMFQKYGVALFQIGARNAQNQTLLNAVSKAGVPALLKNGMNTSDKEWMGSASRFLPENLVLCMRGRNYDTEIGRNALDLIALAHYRQEGKHPIVVDPSHSSGKRNLVYDVSIGAVAAGAHGLIIETHDDPMIARTDGAQSVTPKQLAMIVKDARAEHARYVESADRRQAFMDVTIPEWATIYMKQPQLEALAGFLAGQEVKPYVPHRGTNTDVVVSRVSMGKLGKMRKAGFAIGRLHHLHGELPHVEAVNIKITGHDTIRLSPYQADAIHARGGTTSLDRGQFTHRYDMLHGYGDTVRKAFQTWEHLEALPRIPLVLYRPLKG